MISSLFNWAKDYISLSVISMISHKAMSSEKMNDIPWDSERHLNSVLLSPVYKPQDSLQFSQLPLIKLILHFAATLIFLHKTLSSWLLTAVVSKVYLEGSNKSLKTYLVGNLCNCFATPYSPPTFISQWMLYLLLSALWLLFSIGIFKYLKFRVLQLKTKWPRLFLQILPLHLII